MLAQPKTLSTTRSAGGRPPRRRRRLLFVPLLAALVASGVVACSDGGTPDGAAPSGSTVTTSVGDTTSVGPSATATTAAPGTATTSGATTSGATTSGAATSTTTTATPTTPTPSTPSPTTPTPSTPTPTTTTTTTTTTKPAEPRTLRRGDSGAAVRAVQERLDELDYWVGPVDGNFGDLTQQAVYALQKAAGISRDGVVGPKTRRALDDGVQPEVRSSSGDLVEVDRDRQLLLVVQDGELAKTFNTSTGTYREYTYNGTTQLADTPAGHWSVSWQVDGWRDGALGMMYRPKYFNPQGIAVHGYSSVPPYPASHGCVRVSLPAIDWIWAHDVLPIGAEVWVY